MVLYLFLSGWVGLHALFNSFLTKIFIDRLEIGFLAFSDLLFPGLLLLLNYEFHNFSWRGIQGITIKIIPILKAQITEDLLKWIHKKPYADFQSNLSGTYAKHLSLISDTFERLVGNVFIRLIRGGVQFVASLILMSLIHPLFSLVFLLWSAFFVSFSLLFSRKIQHLSMHVAEKQAEVTGQIVDSFGNSKEVRIFDQITRESEILSQFLLRFKKAYRNRGKFFLKFYFVQGLSITLLMGTLLYFLVQLRVENSITIGDFAFILSSAFFLTEMVWANTELIDQFNQEVGQCNQCLYSLLHTETPKVKKFTRPFTIKTGEIFFQNIAFGYSKDRPLYQNETILIRGGEKVGLVGRSGAGKSTLIHLLLGLYPLQNGEIFIDGQPIQTIPHLHSWIATFSQDPSLFHRSLLENIRFGQKNATEDEVMRVGKLVGIEEIIKDRKEGYNTLLGEKGLKLSGGEKQRVALARVLLKNAPILILDEPSSQLDTLSEEALKTVLHPFMEGKTTIAIAHRLSTLTLMDRILVIEQGKIIQQGTHEELILEEGIYKEMWSTQVRKDEVVTL